MKEESVKAIADFFIVLFLLLGTSLFALYFSLGGPVYLLGILHAFGLGILSVVFSQHSHNVSNITFVFSLVFSTFLGFILGLQTGLNYVFQVLTKVISGSSMDGVAPGGNILSVFGPEPYNTYIAFPLIFIFFLLPFVIYLLSKKDFNRSFFWWYVLPIAVFALVSFVSLFFAQNIIIPF